MSSADYHGGDADVLYSMYDSERQMDIFSLQLFFMRFMGQVPMQLDQYFPKSWQRFGQSLAKCYCAFCVISSFHMAILFLKTTYDMLQNGELEEITDSLTMAIIYCFSTFATCYWLWRSQRLTAFISDVNKRYRHHSMAGLTFVAAKRSILLAHKISFYWLIACAVGVVCWGLAPMLLGVHVLPLKCWYPFDPLVCVPLTLSYMYLNYYKISETYDLRGSVCYTAMVSVFNGLYLWQWFCSLCVHCCHNVGSI